MSNSQKVHHRNFTSLSIVTTVRVLIVSSIMMIATDRIEATLIIAVEEDTVNNEINFSWNGIIGDSGAGVVYGVHVSADYISPNDYISFNVADRSRADVANTGQGDWLAHMTFSGPHQPYGSGWVGSWVQETNFVVNSNTPWAVKENGLFVGSITDGGSDVPDLATHTFSGSFTLPGDFATYALFDTAGTDISVGPVTLWTANSGSGSIVFQDAATIPEPSTGLLSLLGLAGCILARCRRRSVRG